MNDQTTLFDKLQTQIGGVASRVDAIMAKFDTAAESMLTKAARTVPDATALHTENVTLKSSNEELRKLIISLHEWSMRPDCLTPDAMRIWATVTDLVASWKQEHNNGQSVPSS